MCPQSKIKSYLFRPEMTCHLISEQHAGSCAAVPGNSYPSLPRLPAAPWCCRGHLPRSADREVQRPGRVRSRWRKRWCRRKRQVVPRTHRAALQSEKHADDTETEGSLEISSGYWERARSPHDRTISCLSSNLVAGADGSTPVPRRRV